MKELQKETSQNIPSRVSLTFFFHLIFGFFDNENHSCFFPLLNLTFFLFLFELTKLDQNITKGTKNGKRKNTLSYSFFLFFDNFL